MNRSSYSNDDVDWLIERVRFYIRKGFQAIYAIDRAKADFAKRQ